MQKAASRAALLRGTVRRSEGIQLVDSGLLFMFAGRLVLLVVGSFLLFVGGLAAGIGSGGDLGGASGGDLIDLLRRFSRLVDGGQRLIVRWTDGLDQWL